MLFFGNSPFAKINKKKAADIENQIGLIKQHQANLYKSYTNPKDSTYYVLNSLADYMTITLVNDAQYTFNLDLQNALSLWDKNVNDSARIDIADCMVVDYVLKTEATIINNLTRAIYKDIHDNQVRKEIAELLLQYASLVNAVDEAYQIDDGKYSYSWGQYFSGQMFTYDYLTQRLAELTLHPDLAYTTFNGNEILYNHQLPFTGAEQAGKEVNNMKKRQEAMRKQQMAQQQAMQQQAQAQQNMNNGNNMNGGYNNPNSNDVL